jgi:PAS domain S-box-containing protein
LGAPEAPTADSYHRLVRQAGHLLWTVTADGLIDAEQSWRLYTGQSLGEARGWGWLEAIHPDDRERVRQEWTEALTARERYESVYRLRRADGTYRTLLVQALPLPDSDGRAWRWAAFGADVTAKEETEAALRASEAARLAHEEQLRAIVANAPIVLFAVDRAGIFTLSRGLGLEALGITPDGHVGQSYFTLYGHLPESVATMRRVLAGEPATTIERFRDLVFETRWMPTRDAEGTVTGVIGVSADITARARAEEERDTLLHRERQARAEAAERAATLAATFDAITDGVLVYDRDGRLIRANAAAHTANAWSTQAGYRDLPFGERVRQALPRDAEGRPLAREEWPVSRVLRGEVLTGEVAVDTLVRQPDGQDVLLSVSGAPIRDSEGRIVGGVIVDRDVTERRRLERRTREALDALLKVARVLMRVPDEADDPAVSGPSVTHRLGVLMREVLGCRGLNLIAVTPENELRPLECVGLSPEQTEQWRDRITHWPWHTPLFRALMARWRAGETVRVDTTRPEQREMANPFEIGRYLVAPMRVGSTLVGLLSAEYGRGDEALAREDITLVETVATLAALVLERERLLREREEARASALALREATRRMDEFLSVASHELRTPLTGLGGSLQIMKRRLARATGGAGDPPDGDPSEGEAALSRLSPFLERALRQNGVLASLVDDLLDLSRIQAGRLQLRLAPCDLVSLVARTIEERSLLDPARLITRELPPAPVLVDADGERLGQVVDHYLDNALKYSTEEQPVTVGVTVNGGMARVWVRDGGPGIPVAEQEPIWGRFYRVAGTGHRSGSSVGLGLGLYISRGIIERHGGQTGVESVPGSGATFWFRLPLAAPSGAWGTEAGGRVERENRAGGEAP